MRARRFVTGSQGIEIDIDDSDLITLQRQQVQILIQAQGVHTN